MDNAESFKMKLMIIESRYFLCQLYMQLYQKFL